MAAPQSFATKAEATGYLAALRTDQGRGAWVDPAFGRVPFGEYAALGRPGFRPDAFRRVRGDLDAAARDPAAYCELYTSLLTNHLRPTSGDIALAKINPRSTTVHLASRRLSARPTTMVLDSTTRLRKGRVPATTELDE